MLLLLLDQTAAAWQMQMHSMERFIAAFGRNSLAVFPAHPPKCPPKMDPPSVSAMKSSFAGSCFRHKLLTLEVIQEGVFVLLLGVPVSVLSSQCRCRTTYMLPISSHFSRLKPGSWLVSREPPPSHPAHRLDET